MTYAPHIIRLTTLTDQWPSFRAVYDVICGAAGSSDVTMCVYVCCRRVRAWWRPSTATGTGWRPYSVFWIRTIQVSGSTFTNVLSMNP